MKTKTPFTFYTFRYDNEDTSVFEKIKAYIIREIPKYAVFIEISTEVGKTHIQGKIGKCISHEQLRKHFKSEFPNLFDKSNYSIAPIKDIEQWDSYICKDGNVLCNNVFTQEFIDEQVEKHKVCVNNHKKKMEKKQSAVSFTQKVFADFLIEFPLDVRDIQYYSHYEGTLTEYELKCYDRATSSLLSYILKRLGKVVKVFDDCVLQRLYSGIKNSIIQLDEGSALRNVSWYKSKIQM